ncbi:type II secretion system F family protein [Erwinia sp. INIA-01]|uniref:type II secretion system F family protein n=1 Tax=Erwinia sp. INIA01 TaxID=2991500 RepID=UPI00222554A3|nr:type II secretion system F family protein [Erwinia sp. INIA01]MCW1874911.1 type II secretion system F family protein [Erwinia sp. INIA01]
MNAFKLNLITGLVFLSVLIVVLAVSHWRRQRQLDEQRRLRFAQILGEGAEAAGEEDVSILRSQAQTPLASVPLLGPLLAKLWQQLAFIGWQPTLRKRLLILSAVGLLVGMTLGQRTPMPLTFGLLFSVLVTLAIAVLLFRSSLQKHLHQLREGLPDAIDAITRSVRAGVPMAEYRFFAVILIINQEAGGRLGETLERLATTLRQRRELAMKVQSKTSEARASAKIVAALFPCCLGYMYLKSPEDITFLFSDPVGSTILIYALCSITLGMLITHLMVKRIA